MKKFEFKSKVEPVEICGKEYTFDTGNVDWLSKVFGKHDEVIEALEGVKGEGWTKNKVDLLVSALKLLMDTMLGDGEFERVFNSDECNKNINYMTSLCTFMVDEINSQAGQ